MNSKVKYVLIFFIGITLFVSCEPEQPKVSIDKPTVVDEPPIEEIQFSSGNWNQNQCFCLESRPIPREYCPKATNPRQPKMC